MPILESKSYTSTRRVIYRCKPCKVARRLVYSVQVTSSTSVLPTGGGFKTTSREGEIALQGEVPAGFTAERIGSRYTLILKCPGGHRMTETVVQGRFSADHKCGARCRNAVGGDCECQCAGAHHGAGHG